MHQEFCGENPVPCVSVDSCCKLRIAIAVTFCIIKIDIDYRCFQRSSRITKSANLWMQSYLGTHNSAPSEMKNLSA